MKYKIIGLCTVVIAAALTAAVSMAVPEENGERYVQHIKSNSYSPCTEHNGDGLCTHLPIIKIDTGGVEIPGRPVHNDMVHITEYTLAADGSETIAGRAEVIDEQGVNHHLSDNPSISCDIRIRCRGNSSRWFDKASYALEFIDENGENNPQELMGMDGHHEWILHGPYLDKTLIRNYMWYNIAGQLMDYAPNVRLCELFLNGEYRGVYLAAETITAGKNGARIQLSVDKKDNTFTGYILRHDRGSSNEMKNIEPFCIYTYRSDKKMNIVYPGAANINEQLARTISLEFSDFEKAVYSFDFDDKEKGYQATVDTDSFVDYFLINELSLNRDAGLYSTYIYKDIDGKYKMCVWDFNNSLDNYEETPNYAEGFVMQETLWFNRLIQDEDFTDMIIRRYRQLRKTVFSNENLNSFIDGAIAYLGEAVDRNYEKWGYSFAESEDRLYPKWRNPRSYGEAAEDMMERLNERLVWMDDNIETLRQYSAPSKTRESHEAHE